MIHPSLVGVVVPTAKGGDGAVSPIHEWDPALLAMRANMDANVNFLNAMYGGMAKAPARGDCEGCGAPLKYTRHSCEYCGRNP